MDAAAEKDLESLAPPSLPLTTAQRLFWLVAIVVVFGGGSILVQGLFAFLLVGEPHCGCGG